MESEIAPNAWRSTAAYLYILELDDIQLAWEYLRRNPNYRSLYSQRHPSPPDAEQWHCRRFEDPTRDARHAQLESLSDEEFALELTLFPASVGCTKFSIWRISGIKALTRTPTGWRLTIRDGTQLWRLSLNDQLIDGQSFAFQISGGSDPQRYLRLMSRINAWMTPRHRPKRSSIAVSFRPSREAVLHMRTLQAMDSSAAGASHKETAEALFGADDVWQRWGKDSELRSQIRRLLRRGCTLANGNYRRLLTHANSGGLSSR
jgi:hypothetical protein